MIMKTFVRKKQYKAKAPEETVAEIKQILESCNIIVGEEKRKFEKPGVASCRIWLSGGDISFGDFGTNGKGMTEMYSLASAYGEMMERLSNFILLGDYCEDAYRKGMTKYITAPDETMLNAADALVQGWPVLSKLLRVDEDFLKEKCKNTDAQACVPYYDLFNDRTVNLPHKTLRMVIGSNGMAAGNTYMEAVTQGLSEIYERAAVLECYRENPEIHLLHPESFRGNKIYEKLERMKSFGYGYRILDLSMGKAYPVVGLLLEKNGRKAFRAGADPCPVTALERCLTEIFQGDEISVNNFFKERCCKVFPGINDEWERMSVNDEEIAYHVDGSGLAPECIFNPSEEFAENFAGTDGESEKTDYEYMVNLTKSLGFGLYIRDWSFLDFPAYQIIVPELSNYDLIYEEGRDVYGWSFEKANFRNDRFTKACADVLNNLFAEYEKNIPVQGKEMIRR